MWVSDLTCLRSRCTRRVKYVYTCTCMHYFALSYQPHPGKSINVTMLAIEYLLFKVDIVQKGYMSVVARYYNASVCPQWLRDRGNLDMHRSYQYLHQNAVETMIKAQSSYFVHIRSSSIELLRSYDSIVTSMIMMLRIGPPPIPLKVVSREPHFSFFSFFCFCIYKQPTGPSKCIKLERHI